MNTRILILVLYCVVKTPECLQHVKPKTRLIISGARPTVKLTSRLLIPILFNLIINKSSKKSIDY